MEFRASRYEREGRRFESCRLLHIDLQISICDLRIHSHRIPVPTLSLGNRNSQIDIRNLFRGRLIGRTVDFESADRGSNPRPEATFFESRVASLGS